MKEKLQLKKANLIVIKITSFKFMEVSAKAGINTKEIFIDAARFLYDDFLHYKEKVKIGNDESSEDSRSFDHELDESYKIKSKNEKKNKFKGGCC